MAAMRPPAESVEKLAYRKAARQLKPGVTTASATRLLDAWFATLPAADRSAGFSALIARYGGVLAATTHADLLNTVFNRHNAANDTDPAALRRLLHTVRSRWHKQHHSKPQANTSALRALNPPV
jgi:hypothetical protein